MNEATQGIELKYSEVNLTEKQKERFWSKVDKLGNSKPPSTCDVVDDCWMWSGGLSGNGYGCVSLSKNGRKTYGAHVMAFILNGGKVALNQQVNHLCDVKRCCRPSHLYAGTSKQNGEDAVSRGQQPSGDNHGSRLHPEKRPKGEKQWKTFLTEDQIKEIRSKYVPRKVTLKALAVEFNAHFSTIHYIVTKRNWKHVT